MSTLILSSAAAQVEVIDLSDAEVVEVAAEGMELTRSQIAADVQDSTTTIGSALVVGVNNAPAVAPQGTWAFAQVPTAEGKPLNQPGDATATTKGISALAGDLGGTADAPQVISGAHHTHTPDQAGAVPTTAKGAANGVATLGADGKVPVAQLPSIAISEFLGAVSTQAAMLALTGQRGDWCTRTDLGADFILIADTPATLASWRQITSPGGVTSVAGRTGAVVLSTTDLSNFVTAVQALIGSKVAPGTGIDVSYDSASGTTTVSNTGIPVVAANMPAQSLMVVVQNANGTWGSRPTSRTDILVLWVRIVANSTNPARVTSPATNGAYDSDVVVGV